MFDIITNYPDQVARPDALDDLQAFAEEHREALLHAAEWLGGRRGARSAHEALDSLRALSVSPQRVLRLFGNLLDLLMLEHVHDPEREEAGIFVDIDLNDPRVEVVCLLADDLSAALQACREAMVGSAVDMRRAAA